MPKLVSVTLAESQKHTKSSTH